MELKRWVMGDLQVNTFLVWSDGEAGIIDPGGAMTEVFEHLTRLGLRLAWIVNTHGHADHIAGNAEIHSLTGAPIIIHPNDRPMLVSAAANLSAYIGAELVSPDADRTVRAGDHLELGREILTVIETPGHTVGSISLYAPGLLFSGDALFYESIGRTDFPGGDHRQLLASIKERLLTLPQDTLVWPGHDRSTSIGHETDFNPYLHE